MAKELPYFQFEVSEYLNGDIQYCSLEAQGLFINICSMYWHKSCRLTTIQILKRFPNSGDAYNELIDECILNNNQDVVIKFLDDQFIKLESRKRRLSEAGKKGAKAKKKQALMKPPLNLDEATLKQPEEKRREEKRINIPAYIDFLKYAVSKKPKLNEDVLKLKYDSWIENDWKDGNNKPIKNWKTKVLNTLPYIEETSKRVNTNPTVHSIFTDDE